MVRGCSGTKAIFCWAGPSSASAAAPPTAKNSKAKTNLRILLLPSVCQTEFNANASRIVHRLALAQSRLEFNLLRSLRSGFIEPVSKAADHAVHLHVPAGQKDRSEEHTSLQPKITPFGGARHGRARLRG